MNTNLIHNILNVMLALASGATAVMLTSGCTTLVSGALECSQSWISPEVAAYGMTGLATLKIAINVFRDGFAGLFKQQPPVR